VTPPGPSLGREERKMTDIPPSVAWQKRIGKKRRRRLSSGHERREKEEIEVDQKEARNARSLSLYLSTTTGGGGVRVVKPDALDRK